ncbi:MAG: GlsB/YeaQ/YmgE family stress response membrane protein [Actinomycetota bacterium]|nr:GlsB/YeaQ/YmgE family stress response membrane protein [Actinomycetota bacterium]
MGGILSLLITGLIVGLLGRLIVPGRQPIGFIRTILVGIGGSLAGAYLGQEILHFGSGGRFVLGVLVAAVLVVLVEGSVRTRRW